MPEIEISTLTNWIISGFIGLVFGIVSAWITHRYEKKRDDVAWEREKEKLKQQFEHEYKVLELQHHQRIKELEKQFLEQKQNEIKNELLKGLDNPEQEIKKFATFSNIPIIGTVHAGGFGPTSFDPNDEYLDENNFDIYQLAESEIVQEKVASKTVRWFEVNSDHMNLAKPININGGDFVLLSFEKEVEQLQHNDLVLIASPSDDQHLPLSLRRYKETEKLLIPESTFSYPSIPIEKVQVIGVAVCVAKQRLINDSNEKRSQGNVD